MTNTQLQFQAGDVIHLQDAGLPYIILVDHYPDGLWEDADGLFVGYCLEHFNNIPRKDREVGIPYFYFVRDTDWVEKDEVLEEEGDFFITDQVFYFLECMFQKATVVGKVEESAVDIALQRHHVDWYPELSDEYKETVLGLHYTVQHGVEKLLDAL